MWGDQIVRDRACGDRHGARGWREGLGGKALKNHRSHPNVALCCAHGEWQSLNLGLAPPPENDGRGKPRPSFGDRKRTSERRRPLGRSLAMSGGRTTCLSRAGRRKKRGSRGQLAELFGVEAGVRVGCTKAIRVRAREPPYRRVAIDPNADFGRQTLHSTQTNVPIAFIAREPRNRRDGDAGARRGETPIFRARGKTTFEAQARNPGHTWTVGFAPRRARSLTCTRRCRRSTSRSTESEA